MNRELELVLRAGQGDQAAFGRLVEHHWVRLVRLARSVVGEAEAEDVVQDGLLRAWHKLPGLREPAAFSQWMSRVVLRICFRRARGHSASFVSLEAVPEPSSESNPGPRIDVGRLLASLPPRQRAVMHLTVVEGMTDSEIAGILGIAPSSVRGHRRRARGRLEQQVAIGVES